MEALSARLGNGDSSMRDAINRVTSKKIGRRSSVSFIGGGSDNDFQSQGNGDSDSGSETNFDEFLDA